MAKTRVMIRNNGPILIQGDFEVVDAEGNPYGLAGRTQIGLCRCGESENKPFCDGKHKVCKFESNVAARELPPPKPKPETKQEPETKQGPETKQEPEPDGKPASDSTAKPSLAPDSRHAQS